MQIRTCNNQQLDNFLVASFSRTMQRSRSALTLRVHIHAFVQFSLNTRKVTVSGSIVNRISEDGSHQHHGCDCCE
jgi:hypothetical protein